MPWLNVFYSFLACCCWNVWCDKKAINSNPQVTWYLDLELNGIQNNVLSCASSQVSVLLTPVVRWIHYTLWTCWCNKEKDYLIFKSYFQDNKKLEFQNILCRFLPYSYAFHIFSLCKICGIDMTLTHWCCGSTHKMSPWNHFS